MIRNNLSWINLNAGSSGGSGGGGVSDYNDLANRPIISMTGTSQNPLKLWNLSTGLYLLNGYVYYNTTNTRECVNLFVSITAQIQNGKYVLSAFVPSWEGHYEYIKANSTSTNYTDTQILKMLTEDDVLTLTNEVEYTPTTDYHPSTKKYVDEAMQSVMEEFAKMGVNEQDIKTLIAENRRRDIAIQALLNETADKNVTIEEDTHTISLDYSMEDGMATVNSIEGSTLVNVSKTVDEVYITKSQDRVEQSKVANTIGEQNGKICPIIEGDTLVNVCDQKDPIAITKSYTIENSGNHIALQGEYDGKCRPVVHGNTMTNYCTDGHKEMTLNGTAVVAEGINVTLNDTVDNGLVDVVCEGNTLVNIWSREKTDFFIENGSFENGVVNCATGWCCSKNVEWFKPNTEYTIITNVISISGTDTYLRVNEEALNGVFTSSTKVNIVNKVGIFIDKLTTKSTITSDVVFGARSNFNGEGSITYNMIVLEGDWTNKEIPQYFEGMKSVVECEDNKLEIVSQKQNKNLFNKEKYSYTDNYFIDTDGVAKPLNGYIAMNEYMTIKPNTTYATSNINCVVEYDANKNITARNMTWHNNVFTTTESTKYIRLQLDSDDDLEHLQIEEGSVATSYVPHVANTKEITLSEPLRALPNGVKDKIVKIGGKWYVERNCGELKNINTILSTAKGSNYGFQDNEALFLVSSNYFKNVATSNKLLFKGSAWTHTTSSDQFYITPDNDLWLRLPVTSKSEAIEYLKDVIIVAELITPIYEPLEVEPTLNTYNDTTHISNNSTIPCNMIVKNTKYNCILKPDTLYTVVLDCDKKAVEIGLGGTKVTTTNNVTTVTTPSTLTDSNLELYGKGVTVSNVMIFEGDLTQTPNLIPTEYVEGLQSSFEDNLVTQAMVDSGEESVENLGKYKVEYKVTGKNKFDEKYFISHNCSFKTFLLKGDYTFTGTFYTEGGRVGLWFRDESGSDIADAQVLVSNGKSTIKFTNPKSQLVTFVRHGWDSSVVYLSCENLQLEEGTQATEYEPYKEYTKTFYLNSPLLEGDTIEDINGVATHVKRYGKVVLDGSNEFRNEITQGEDNITFLIQTYDMASWNKNECYLKSDRLPACSINNRTSECLYRQDSGTPRIALRIFKTRLQTPDIEGCKQWLQENPITVIYPLASPIYEKISNESILCDSYVNGHLDFDSAVPIEKVGFKLVDDILNNYLLPSTLYTLKFDSDNSGVIGVLYLGGRTVQNNILVKKGVNTISFTLPNTLYNNKLHFDGIGFNASNIVVTEAVDKEFDYFNGIQSTFEENLVTDENNPHYGKYRVIYRTKSSDGNASTVKSVYLNSPLLQGDKLVVVNGKLCHYHKMGMVVFDGSENWFSYLQGAGIRIPEKADAHVSYLNIHCDKLKLVSDTDFREDETLFGITSMWNDILYIRNENTVKSLNEFKKWLQANPTTVVYELASPYYEEISSNPKDTVVDFYTNGTLEVQSAVYPLSMEFTSFEEELTYLYASTVYTVQFEANGNAIANIILGGTTVTNQEITHGLNKIQVTTPSALVDNKLIIDGCGDCKISKVVVTNSTEEFEYFEGMKSAFEDKQNEDGTYTVEIVVYNAPIRLNKDKE